MKEVREVPPEQWDNLVRESEQGTIFCQTKWLELYGLYRLWGYYNNDSLLGGICGFSELSGAGKLWLLGAGIPLIPFLGVLVAPQNSPKYTTLMSMQNEVASGLIDGLRSEGYRKFTFSNHYTFTDMRPFVWRKASVEVRYTYVVDTSDLQQMWKNLEKQTRYEASRPAVMRQWSLGYFDELYAETFKRKGLPRPISSEFLKRLNDAFDCRIVGTGSSMAYVVWDNKRAYYILGASDGTGSAATVWAMLDGVNGMGIKELDMVGANDRDIARFKAGFGGKLRAYYQVSL